jgi:hypothetical protein
VDQPGKESAEAFGDIITRVLSGLTGTHWIPVEKIKGFPEILMAASVPNTPMAIKRNRKKSKSGTLLVLLKNN